MNSIAPNGSPIVLLDGGTGQELIHRSSRPPTRLWSASVMMDEPGLVEAVHRDFIDAGARVLTLNNYTATPQRLAREQRADWFTGLHQAAILAAQRSRQHARQPKDISLAGCLPPLVSSYHSADVPQAEVCLDQYRQLVAAQAHAVDLFLCETLSTVVEVQTAVKAACESGKTVWVAMTVDDQDGTRLRSGQTLADGVAAAVAGGADAVLINCSWPEAATQGMDVLSASGLPFGAYANGFTQANHLQKGATVATLQARADLDPIRNAQHAMAWVAKGARIVGGCCEVGPAHIRELAQVLQQNGFVPVQQLPA